MKNSWTARPRLGRYCRCRRQSRARQQACPRSAYSRRKEELQKQRFRSGCRASASWSPDSRTSRIAIRRPQRRHRTSPLPRRSVREPRNRRHSRRPLRRARCPRHCTPTTAPSHCDTTSPAPSKTSRLARLLRPSCRGTRAATMGDGQFPAYNPEIAQKIGRMWPPCHTPHAGLDAAQLVKNTCKFMWLAWNPGTAAICSGGGAPFQSAGRSRTRIRAYSRCLRVELHAQARGGTPDHVARRLDVIDLDHQHEFVRNADLARNFQASTDRRQVAHPAIENRSPVDCDAAGLQRAMTLGLASLVHEILRRAQRSRTLRVTRWGQTVWPIRSMIAATV